MQCSTVERPPSPTHCLSGATVSALSPGLTVCVVGERGTHVQRSQENTRCMWEGGVHTYKGHRRSLGVYGEGGAHIPRTQVDTRCVLEEGVHTHRGCRRTLGVCGKMGVHTGRSCRRTLGVCGERGEHTHRGHRRTLSVLCYSSSLSLETGILMGTPSFMFWLGWLASELPEFPSVSRNPGL